jgi:hypothetical protein
MGRPSLHCTQEEVFRREYWLAALPGIPGPKHQRRVHTLRDEKVDEAFAVLAHFALHPL